MATIKKNIEIQFTHEEIELAIRQYASYESDELLGDLEVELNSLGAIVRCENTEEL